MRYFLICAVLTVGMPALADEAWVPMTGADIRIALTGSTVTYASAWQEFRASGRTLYNAGSDSWGYWRIEGDQYCSQWPPSDLWTCYDMARPGERLRFIGASGDATDATYREWSKGEGRGPSRHVLGVVRPEPIPLARHVMLSLEPPAGVCLAKIKIRAAVL